MKTPSEASMYQLKDTVRARYGYEVRSARCLITDEKRLQVTDGPNVINVCSIRTVDDYYEAERDGSAACHEIFTTVKGNRFLYWEDADYKGYLAQLQKEEEKKEANDGAKTEHDGR